jgi:hypothetical protein
MDWPNDVTFKAKLPRKIVVNFSIEHMAAKSLETFAANKGTPKSNAMRVLIETAVRYWREHNQSLDRKAEYPWDEWGGGALRAKGINACLDQSTLDAVREIAAKSGKRPSRVVSEIIMDAMKAGLGEPGVKAPYYRSNRGPYKEAV